MFFLPAIMPLISASPIMKWFKGKVFALVGIAVLAAILFGAYHFITGKIEEFEENKLTLSRQADQIESLTDDFNKLKKSSETTQQSLSALFLSQKEIDRQSKVRTADISNKIKGIMDGAGTPEEKSTEVSRVYIESLQQNYCSIKPENCISGKLKEEPK